MAPDFILTFSLNCFLKNFISSWFALFLAAGAAMFIVISSSFIFFISVALESVFTLTFRNFLFLKSIIFIYILSTYACIFRI